VLDLDSRRVTRSAVPRCEVQVVMITPGYALAPLTGTPGPANARENPGLPCWLSFSRPSLRQLIYWGDNREATSRQGTTGTRRPLVSFSLAGAQYINWRREGKDRSCS